MIKPIRITQPATLPVTLAMAKLHLRLDAGDDDVLTLLYASAATARIEGMIEKALITQQWKEQFNRFPACGEVIGLSRPPVQTIDSIEYYDSDDALQTLGTEVYTFLADGSGAFVSLQVDQAWPSTSVREDAVTITYTAGYGDNPQDVPPDIRSAVLLVAGHLYENREATAGAAMSGLSAELPLSVHWLLADYRGRYAF